jgi:hypothetical protein
MGRVYEEYGAVLGITNPAAYGTDTEPVDAMRLAGQPGYDHQDTFENDEEFELYPTSSAGDREHGYLGLTFQNKLGFLVDQVAAISASDAALQACGAIIKDTEGSAGVGNYAEYGPTSANWPDSVFYGLWREDGNGNLARQKHLGTRGTFNLQIQGTGAVILDLTLRALHGFYEEFAGVATIPGPATKGLGVGFFKGKCVSAKVKERDSADAYFDLGIDAFTFSPNNTFEDNTEDIEACDEGVSEIIMDPGEMGGQLTLKFLDTLIADTGPGNWVKRVHNNDLDLDFVLEINDGVNLFRISFPNMRWTTMQPGSGNSRKQFTVDYLAQALNGDDNYLMRFEKLA